MPESFRGWRPLSWVINGGFRFDPLHEPARLGTVGGVLGELSTEGSTPVGNVQPHNPHMEVGNHAYQYKHGC